MTDPSDPSEEEADEFIRGEMARAVRFVAENEDVDLNIGGLHELADRIESGEVTP